MRLLLTFFLALILTGFSTMEARVQLVELQDQYGIGLRLEDDVVHAPQLVRQEAASQRRQAPSRLALRKPVARGATSVASAPAHPAQAPRAPPHQPRAPPFAA